MLKYQTKRESVECLCLPTEILGPRNPQLIALNKNSSNYLNYRNTMI